MPKSRHERRDFAGHGRINKVTESKPWDSSNAEYPLPPVPCSVQQPKAVGQREPHHREAVLGYSGPKPHGLWASFNIPTPSLLCQTPAGCSTALQDPPSSGRQQRQLCQDCSSAQLPRLQSCSQSSASAHNGRARALDSPWLCQDKPNFSPRASQVVVTGISPSFITAPSSSDSTAHALVALFTTKERATNQSNTEPT